MPIPGLSPRGILIIDNNVLSGLNEYFCERRAPSLPTANRVAELEAWMHAQFDTLCHFAIDGKVYCTDCVAEEFSPSGVLFANMTSSQREGYKSRIRTRLNVLPVDMREIQWLRGMSGVRPELVGPSGVSDNDFSLILLSVELAVRGEPVYVITDDQALLDYISWVRTRPEARSRWPTITKLQGLRDLVYFDLIHRQCEISTWQMQDLLSFCIKRCFERAMGELDKSGRQASSVRLSQQKASRILQQCQEVQVSLIKSAQIKALGGEALL